MGWYDERGGEIMRVVWRQGCLYENHRAECAL
jgi:hypothetical protein